MQTDKILIVNTLENGKNFLLSQKPLWPD